MRLGWYDLILAYRRTLLGPLWLSVQLVIWSAGLALVFGPMHTDDPLYIPYLVIGMSIWNFLSGVIVQGSGVYVSNTGLILSMPLNLNSLVIRQWSNLVYRFFFQVIVLLPVVWLYDLSSDIRLLEAIVALALLCVFGFSMISVMGITSTYFRDFEHLVSVSMRFLFFLTPVFWIPQSGQFQAAFVQYNPLYYPLEMVRRPLIGSECIPEAWLIVVISSVLGFSVSWLLNHLFADKLPTWL